MGGPVRAATERAHGDSTTRAIPHERWIAVGVTTVVVLVVMATAWRDNRNWLPTTDWALIELRVRHIASLPTLGVPAVAGFHHPGPLLYYALAPLYRLGGSDPHALLLSTAFLNSAAIAGIGWTAWRRGRLPFVALALATIVWLAGSLPAGFLRDPWNPWLALVPFAWFVLLIWSVVVDDLLALPIAAFVGSYVVQAHIGYVPVVAVLFALALGAICWRAWRDRSTDERSVGQRPLRIVLALTLLVLAVAWALPLREQVTQHPGNVTLIERSFTDPNAGPRLTVDQTGRVAGTEMGLMSPWFGFTEPVNVFSGTVVPGTSLTLLFSPALIAVGFVLSRRNSSARGFVVVVAIANFAAIIALSRLEQERVSPYVVRFTWVLAAYTVLATAWALASRGGTPHAPRAVSAAGLGLLAVGLVRFIALDGSAMIPVYQPDQHASQAACVSELLPALRTDAAGRDVGVSTTESWPIIAGSLLNELDRSQSVGSLGNLRFFTGEAQSPEHGGDTNYLVVDRNEEPDWRPSPDMVLVASCDTLTPAERDELTTITAKSDRTTAEGIRLIDLGPRDVRAAVYRTG